eukprot:9385049-Alexandrium_andersonii.AAC.1
MRTLLAKLNGAIAKPQTDRGATSRKRRAIDGVRNEGPPMSRRWEAAGMTDDESRALSLVLLLLLALACPGVAEEVGRSGPSSNEQRRPRPQCRLGEAKVPGPAAGQSGILHHDDGAQDFSI